MSAVYYGYNHDGRQITNGEFLNANELEDAKSRYNRIVDMGNGEHLPGFSAKDEGGADAQGG